MAKLIKVTFNESANPFLIENIKSTRNVDGLLLNRIKNNVKKIWGFLPLDKSSTVDYNFNEGGIYYDNPINQYASYIYETILVDKDYSWILIDNNSSTEESLKNISIDNLTNVFFYEQTVFHYLPDNLINIKNIKTTIEGGGWYPFIGLITKINEEIKFQIFMNKITSDNVKSIIDNIKFIVMGAFDEEGYLIIELNE